MRADRWQQLILSQFLAGIINQQNSIPPKSCVVGRSGRSNLCRRIKAIRYFGWNNAPFSDVNHPNSRGFDVSIAPSVLCFYEHP